jgi:hypothetical protein
MDNWAGNKYGQLGWNYIWTTGQKLNMDNWAEIKYGKLGWN